MTSHVVFEAARDWLDKLSDADQASVPVASLKRLLDQIENGEMKEDLGVALLSLAQSWNAAKRVVEQVRAARQDYEGVRATWIEENGSENLRWLLREMGNSSALDKAYKEERVRKERPGWVTLEVALGKEEEGADSGAGKDSGKGYRASRRLQRRLKDWSEESSFPVPGPNEKALLDHARKMDRKAKLKWLERGGSGNASCYVAVGSCMGRTVLFFGGREGR